jgi:hypothetical protein
MNGLRESACIYKTECLLVCIFCIQIYSFTPILMKFCTLDLQSKKKITVYFNLTKTNPYYHFQPCYEKKTVFSSWKYTNLRRFTAISSSEYMSPSPLDTHKKQPLLSFLSLLSKKKIFSSWKSRLHMFRCHSYIWFFFKVAISQNVFE